MDYRGKVVVVTGASSGIGYDTAQAFARRGSTVVAVARREDRLRALIAECQECSPTCSYLAGDLGDRSFAEQVVEHTIMTHGRLDILVNVPLTTYRDAFMVCYEQGRHEAVKVMFDEFT